MTWQTIDRPGYFGSRREERYLHFNKTLGVGCWRIVWQMGKHTAGVEEATMVYEDAYYEYLKSRPELLELLVREASDVYDDSVSNLATKLDYSKQESSRTHLQDVALRRCLVRFGRTFLGHQLVQIRDIGATAPIHPLSIELSPGRVPFHRPEWLFRPELKGWWGKGSLESWYQSNKLLQGKV